MSKSQLLGQVIKNDFYQIKLRICVIPHFYGILTGELFYGLMFVIKGDLQTQRSILSSNS